MATMRGAVAVGDQGWLSDLERDLLVQMSCNGAVTRIAAA